MAAAADRATTLPELMAAGGAYGDRMGAQTIRLVVMLVASVIGEGGGTPVQPLDWLNPCLC